MDPGTKLGPYEITEQLGAGGMGEVYLAQDTRLGRKVAIKVLPAEFASDPERLARFEQEARAAAALNHPHIAAVHDVGVEDGTHFMVQEYLEGNTLREPLGKGALPLKKALGLATEIAEALAAAHAAGIIHRDLKPENIFVTKEGHAKVLDFGLAKLTEVAVTGSPGGATQSPTMMGTVAGQVMGTAGYMAPEQVEGGEVDQRTDMFAFGCVLYEMAQGARAFGGRNVAEVLHRLVNSDPEPMADELPSELHRIVRKCVAKEPAKRYQTAGDLVVDLQALGTDVESGAALPPTPVAVETARGIPWKLAAPVAVAIALLGAFGVWITAPSAPEPIGRRFHIDYPPETSFVNTSTLGFAISPDGRSLVFNANRQLWLRAIDDPVATPIHGTEQARAPFFSPDSQQLGFWGVTSPISTNGGTDPLWSPDGRELFYRQGRQVMVVGVETEGDFEASAPRMLFEGDYVADIYQNWDVASDGQSFVMVLADPERPREIRIVQNWFDELKRLLPTDP